MLATEHAYKLKFTKRPRRNRVTGDRARRSSLPARTPRGGILKINAARASDANEPPSRARCPLDSAGDFPAGRRGRGRGGKR